ncbi:unnamed protein product, partial [Mesorhabditis spiculigera]
MSDLFCTSKCKALTLAQIIEMGMDLTTFSLFILYSYILVKKRVFHLNLLLILIALPGFPTCLSLMIKCINKVVISLNGFNYGNVYTQLSMPISDTGLSCSSYTLMSLAIERFVSTFYFQHYENFCGGWPVLAGCLLFIQLLLAYSTVPLAWSAVISNLFSVGLIIAALFSAIIMFLVINPLVKRHYLKSVENFSGVSRRYQSTENLRIVRVCGTMLIVLLRHPVLKQEFLRITRLEGRRRRGGSPKVKNNIQIFNVDGLQLNYSTKEEKEMYFRMLQNTWNKDF